MNLRYTLLILCSQVALLTAVEGAEWHDTYEAAVDEAKSSQKPLLILFTADWVSMSQQFEEKILKTEEFEGALGDKFVFLRLNFPENNRLPKEKAFKYQLLKDAYRVRGYPSIVLTYEDGRPFGITGFQPMPPGLYAEQIETMYEHGQKKLDLLITAKNLEGLDKAESLIAGIPELPGNMAARYFGDEMKEVIAADPQNELGKNVEYTSLLEDANYSKAMQILAKENKWSEMVELTDSYIEERNLEGSVLQKALLNRSSVQDRMGSLRGRIETLLRVVDIDAESPFGVEAQRQLDELRAEKLRQEQADQEQEP